MDKPHQAIITRCKQRVCVFDSKRSAIIKVRVDRVNQNFSVFATVEFGKYQPKRPNDTLTWR